MGSIDASGWDLHRAAVENRADIAKLLIDQGADIEARDADTPLHMAAWKNSVKVAGFLLDYGASKNAKDEGGRTPLDRANANNHPYPPSVDVARLLGAR